MLGAFFVMLVGCTHSRVNSDELKQPMDLQTELQHETLTGHTESLNIIVEQELEANENVTESDKENRDPKGSQQDFIEHVGTSREEDSMAEQSAEFSSGDDGEVLEDNRPLSDNEQAEVPQLQPEVTLDNTQIDAPILQPEDPVGNTQTPVPEEPEAIVDEEITIKDEAIVPIDPNAPSPEEDDYSKSDKQALAELLQSLSYVHPVCDGLYDYSVSFGGITYYISFWCKCVSIGDYEAHLTDSQVAQIIEYIN